MWYATVWLAPAENLAFIVVNNSASDSAVANNANAFGQMTGWYAPKPSLTTLLRGRSPPPRCRLR